MLDELIARLNIQRFRKLLAEANAAPRQDLLQGLLAEEEEKLRGILAGKPGVAPANAPSAEPPADSPS